MCVVQSVFFYAASCAIEKTSRLHIVVNSFSIFTNTALGAISHYINSFYCGRFIGSNSEGVVVLEICTN
jgi:hypothetical protein